jgi:hypothetical protein
VKAFSWFVEFADDQPRLVRAALYGAGIIFAMTIVRIVFLLPSRDLRGITIALGALGLATLGGAVGGFFYGVLRPIERVPLVGRWLRWTLGIAVYVVAVVGSMAPFDQEAAEMIADPATRVSFVIVCLLYGAVMAWDPDGTDDFAPPPRVPAEKWLQDAMDADLTDLRERGHRDPEFVRFDLIDSSTPSRAYVMHLWRVAARLGRLGNPPRQARIALRRARRLHRAAQRDLERTGA